MLLYCMQDLSTQLQHEEMQPLQPEPAGQLFWSRQTGLVLGGTHSQQPTPQLQQLGEDIIKACARLPLALELAGAQLWQVTATSEWQVMTAVPLVLQRHMQQQKELVPMHDIEAHSCCCPLRSALPHDNPICVCNPQ